MKRTLAFAAIAIAFALSAYAGTEALVLAAYRGTFTTETNALIFIRLYDDHRAEINLVEACDWTCFSTLKGTWSETRLVRSISVMTSSNQFIGTIRKGVVTGNYQNYKTGELGTFRCEP